ncbi:MAG: GNAT family N-acetyltransferase, partial [Actinomycetota bacterium]
RVPSMSALRVEMIVSTQELYSLRDEWDKLWERCPWATPFQSPEWLLPWWTHLGRGKLHTLAMWDGERLAGLAPAFRAPYFRLPLDRVCLLGTGNTDYLDVLLDPGLAADGAGLIVRHLTGALQGAAFIDFQQLRSESPLLSAPETPGWRDQRFEQEVCPALPLPPTVTELHSRLPSRLRSNLRYYRRRIEREGGTIETADAETLPAAMDALFELHQARWRRRRLPGVFSSARVRSFHREAAAGLLARDRLRLHLMRFQGTVGAALYCFACRGRGYYYAGGFNPELSRLSPGTVLTAYAMEDALRAGARTFDFLRGDEPYKYAWGATNRTNHRRLLWRVGGAGAIAPRLVALERRAEQMLKRVARRMQ